jgi:tRNA (guanine37-N1)-methyltransferase
MRVDVITIFPEYLAPLELSLIGRAQAQGLLTVQTHDLREWTTDVHRTVDDTPYGGGPGMVMRPEPWGRALDAVLPGGGGRDGAGPDGGGGDGGGADGGATLVVPSPAGVPFTQAVAHELAAEAHLVFACGRYEGIDARVLELAASRARVREISLGDYVLFGGEVAVLVVLEAVTRLLPGVVGNADSLLDESHAAGLLEAPVYTKPPVYRGLEVPEVLRSGDHGRIARWRRDQALLRTARRRPDLIAALPPDALDKHDRAVLSGGGFHGRPGDMAE